jgi:hypothetical protein
VRPAAWRRAEVDFAGAVIKQHVVARREVRGRGEDRVDVHSAAQGGGVSSADAAAAGRPSPYGAPSF